METASLRLALIEVLPFSPVLFVPPKNPACVYCMYQGVYIVETELFEAFFLLNKQMTKFFMMSVFEDISPAKLYFLS